MSAAQRVKICGISDVATAHVAIEAGVDYIGLNFFPRSHRYVEPERAAEIVRGTREIAPDHEVKFVGLFVNEPVEQVIETRAAVGLDIVQISGDEPPDDMARLRQQDIPFIGTVRAANAEGADLEARFQEIVAEHPYAVILDTHVPGMWGGSGVVGDWELARELAQRYRLLLAGGLDPENVAEAVRTVQPYVADVSSGVETDKRKDHAKIRAFIAAARGAED